MGQQSKAIQACLKNLQKHVTAPKKAYVEDITDEEDAVTSPKIDNINEMEENVRACLDNMPILQIKWFGISSHAYQLLIMDFHQICQQIGLFYQHQENALCP